jgi:hypothetical protein
MLAYVFWHWPQAHADIREYEARQRAFHAALVAAPARGFRWSFTAGISGAPWAATGASAYEDWYAVDDFAALGALNDAAVSGSRLAPHDAAAAAVADGAAGVYGLRAGTALRAPQYAHWFGKPPGMTYRELFAQLTPVVERAQAALWMRQMVLGPAREFCLHAASPESLPAPFEALVVPLRLVFPYE